MAKKRANLGKKKQKNFIVEASGSLPVRKLPKCQKCNGFMDYLKTNQGWADYKCQKDGDQLTERDTYA